MAHLCYGSGILDGRVVKETGWPLGGDFVNDIQPSAEGRLDEPERAFQPLGAMNDLLSVHFTYDRFIKD